jgi:hypothetical protein
MSDDGDRSCKVYKLPLLCTQFFPWGYVSSQVIWERDDFFQYYYTWQGTEDRNSYPVVQAVCTKGDRLP